MPALVAFLVQALEWLMASRLAMWIVSALATIGLSFGTNKIIMEPVFEQLRNAAQNLASGGDYAADAVAWAGVMQLDVAISISISFITLAISITAGKTFLQKRAST